MDSMDRKFALKAFLSSPGYKLFYEEFTAFIEKNQVDLNKDLSQAVTSDRLSHLNFNLGFQKGLEAVSNILLGFSEELDDNSSSPDVNGQQ